MFKEYLLIACFTLLGSSEVSAKPDSPLYEAVKIKTNYTYEYQYHNESKTGDTYTTLGYVESMKILLQEFKAGKIPVDSLNKFDEGIKEYFFFRKMIELDHRSISALQILLRDYYVWGRNMVTVIAFDNNSDFKGADAFSNVTLQWLTSSNEKPEINYEGVTSDLTNKMNLTVKGDMRVIGKTVYNNLKYDFTYNLKNTIISWYIEADQGGITCHHYLMKLQYDSEDFQLTPSGTERGDAGIEDIIRQNFIKEFLNNYLLQFYAFAPLRFFFDEELKFVTGYQERLLSALNESAILYISSKGLNTFEVPLLNSSNGVEHNYKNIRVEGLLNFVKYEALNSSIIRPDCYNIFPDALLLTYPEDGDKQAYITFVIVDQKGENVKKFKIKRISISTTYTAAQVNEHIKMENNKGFDVKFELYNIDLDNEVGLLVKHIENVMTRVIKNFLLN